MIVCNGIIGMCLLTGGVLHRVQSFQLQGTNAALSVLIALTTLTLLPNANQSQAPLATGKTALLSTGRLVVSLVAVVVLAETLTTWLGRVIAAASAPKAAVGVVIATLVLLPKALASLHAGSANRLPASMNLALGSVLASIGLTIPTVAVVAIWLNKPLTFGRNPKEEVLLLTLLVSALTLGTGRRTVL